MIGRLNCQMVDHQKVCRVKLIQSVLRDRKNVCTPRVKACINNLRNFYYSIDLTATSHTALTVTRIYIIMYIGAGEEGRISISVFLGHIPNVYSQIYRALESICRIYIQAVVEFANRHSMIA